MAPSHVRGATRLNTSVRENEHFADRLALENKRVQSLLAVSRMKDATERELVGFALEESLHLTSSTVGYFHFYDQSFVLVLVEKLRLPSATYSCLT